MGADSEALGDLPDRQLVRIFQVGRGNLVAVADPTNHGRGEGLSLGAAQALLVERMCDLWVGLSAGQFADTLDEVTGQIIQGKTKDIPPARRALTDLDTRGVETYDDLAQIEREKIGATANKLDDLLAKDPTLYQADDLMVKAGAVEIRPVNDALDHLEELYRASGEVDEVLRIQTLKTKLAEKGLTVLEVNQVAREYGWTFKRRAFTKLGEPKTAVTALRSEGTRKNIKRITRDLIDDPAAEMLDRAMYDLFRLMERTEVMAEKVNALAQRVSKRGMIEKMARATGAAVDRITFGGPKAFITKLFFPSNVGLKTLNSLDLERLLAKNLAKFANLMTKLK